ncbi:hypothetical protein COSO111634_23405 [Corallococcus soli]
MLTVGPSVSGAALNCRPCTVSAPARSRTATVSRTGSGLQPSGSRYVPCAVKTLPGVTAICQGCTVSRCPRATARTWAKAPS